MTSDRGSGSSTAPSTTSQERHTTGGQRSAERRGDSGGAKKPASTPRHSQPAPTAEQYATQLRETSGAAFLYATMSGLFQQLNTFAFKKFRDQLLVDAGNPTDPIEIMMIEQIVLAHMNVGRLQFRSATAETVDAAKSFGSMAVQLMAEFRRSAISIQAYRYARKNSVRPVALEAPTRSIETAVAVASEQANADGELSSKEETVHGDNIVRFPCEEPEPGEGGSVEHPEEKRVIA